MTERYDSTAARHYAAFRPSLHRPILERLIAPGEVFPVGLDVGCGTGYSAVALAQFCDRVYGVDPSGSMLAEAQRHPKISYMQGSGESLDRLPVRTFNVVTFAGSLFYAKTYNLRRQLARVCLSGTVILVYDFEILLNTLVGELEVGSPVATSDYDHLANLSDWAECLVERSGTERFRLAIREAEMAHLLLADSNRYDAFATRFSKRDPFPSLVEYLTHSSKATYLDADIYFTRYRVL
jgi:ubiquinone/menaquinone biosynthesis C-methylase UbiE